MSARRSLNVVVVLLVAALAPACGGGGSSDKPPPETYVISGTITGSAVELVLLTLGGDAAYAVESDATGAYVFPPVVAGTYSITPTLEDVTFTPINRIVMVVAADVPGVDFVSTGTPPTLDTSPPSSPVRLVFVHHLTGSNWLDAANGGLGDVLGVDNYYVRDVSFGWDAPQNVDIGSRTDIGHWYTWFADTTVQGTSTVRANITGALYAANDQVASYTPITDPGGPNEIILIKSSYPSSAVKTDDVSQPPANLFGQPASNPAHTLGNCKEVYRQILTLFKTQDTRLFIIITAAPMRSVDTLLTDAQHARDLNNWLVNDWLVEGAWENKNVAVFDLFNVLTHADNHHRVVGSEIEHETLNGDNFSDYGVGSSEPNQAGLLKARDEFLPLLNLAYNRWQAWTP